MSSQIFLCLAPIASFYPLPMHVPEAYPCKLLLHDKVPYMSLHSPSKGLMSGLTSLGFRVHSLG